MDCRAGCGACCIAISISSPIPDMPNGKPAGERCKWLTASNKCEIFGKSNRPKICSSFQADTMFCGSTAIEAFQLITNIELATRPL